MALASRYCAKVNTRLLAWRVEKAAKSSWSAKEYVVHWAGVILVSLLVMLKIGTVKWQGKCSRHPMFDPESDGPAAIRGGCPKCQDLQTIFETHQEMVKLMRTFAPPPPPKPKVDPDAGRQQSLFASFG